MHRLSLSLRSLGCVLLCALCTVLSCPQRLSQSVCDGVDYIELMLRRQLIAAVGKELSSVSQHSPARASGEEQTQLRPFGCLLSALTSRLTALCRCPVLCVLCCVLCCQLDFAQYMRYHNRKLYRECFEPKPFCYAIRRPDHYPEGVISIESTSPGDGVAGQTPEVSGAHG